MFKYFFLSLFCLSFLFSSTITSEITDDQKSLLESLPPDQRQSIESKMSKSNKLTDEIEEAFEEKSGMIKRQEEESASCKECIFCFD